MGRIGRYETYLRLTFMILSQYSSVIVSVGMEVGFMPAQLKTWSMRPYFFITSATKAFTLVVEETSNADVICSCFKDTEQSDWVSASEDGLMSCSAHVPPREESFIAVPRPMPLPAPVIRMILFSKEGGIVGRHVG